MRAPRLFRLFFPGLLLATTACGESFEASSGGGGSGGSASAAAAGGGDTTTEPAGGQGGGSTTGQGGGGGGPLCEVEVTNACGECLLAECEIDLCACVGNSACTNLGICISMAGPEPMFANYEYCWQQNKSGIALAGSLQACGFLHCPDCDYAEVSPCGACEYKKCGEQINSCFGDYKCTAYIACLAACPDNDLECVTACGTTHAQGQQLFQAIRLCSKDACDDFCL